MSPINQLIPDSEFQTVVPSNDGTLTVRSNNTESPSNNSLINTYQITTISTVPLTPFQQGTCLDDLTTNVAIATKENLYTYLCDVLIRFDTNPNFYQKEDYKALLRLLVGSLLHLYDTYAHPVSYKITQTPEVLSDIIPTGHIVRTVMIYNNEYFDMTMNLGFTVDGQELLMSETIASKTWWTINVGKINSIIDNSSIYFDSIEAPTSNGIYVVVDSTYYFST